MLNRQSRRDLAGYRNYVDKKQLTQLRKVLLTPIPLNQVEVSQFLYTPIGERLLQKLGKVIQTESRLSGFYAIRCGTNFVSRRLKKIYPLKCIKKFPASQFQLI